MMAEITQLWTTSEHHIVEFAKLRGAIAYVQRGIQWMCKHWDSDTDDDSAEKDDGDDDAF